MIMQYRKDKNGNEISVLGYGCMRFTKEGGHADIDKAEKVIAIGDGITVVGGFNGKCRCASRVSSCRSGTAL